MNNEPFYEVAEKLWNTAYKNHHDIPNHRPTVELIRLALVAAYEKGKEGAK